jgi:hypothetical protein
LLSFSQAAPNEDESIPRGMLPGHAPTRWLRD